MDVWGGILGRETRGETFCRHLGGVGLRPFGGFGLSDLMVVAHVSQDDVEWGDAGDNSALGNFSRLCSESAFLPTSAFSLSATRHV